MNDTIKITKSKKQEKRTVWSTEIFCIDDLNIKVGIIRTNGNEEKNVNHILFLEFYLNNGPHLKIDSKDRTKIENLDTHIFNFFESAKINPYKKMLYFLITNSIILKLLLTKFIDTSSEKNINISIIKSIKNSYDKIANFNYDLSDINPIKLYDILKNPNLLKLISENEINVSEFNNSLNLVLFKKIIEEYEQNLSKNDFAEEQWQQFFLHNSMIISQIFPIPIVFKNDKAFIGGKWIENGHGNLVDFVYKNKFTNNSCIIEIKKPQTELFMTSQYRHDHIYNMSNDLIGGINQLISYKDTFTKEYNNLIANDPNRDFECWNVKTILIIGNTKEFSKSKEKLRQFELFRNSINDVIIITFDELLQKLKGILNIIDSN